MTVNDLDVFSWPRAARSEFNLTKGRGLYALFLREGAGLPTIAPGREGLIYIGKAGGSRGLKGRCHFLGSTRNHSPRKSLAVLLKDELSLEPIIVRKPNSPPTWALQVDSEAKLSQWMQENLLLAVTDCEDPAPIESLLIQKHAPALNLTGCPQLEAHVAISMGRKLIQDQVNAGG